MSEAIGCAHVWKRFGAIEANRDVSLSVRRVGTSADIWRFAHDHSWLYGFAAVLVAALAGWTGSVLFRRN